MFWNERFEATKQYELLGPFHKKKRGMFPVKRIGGRQYRGNAAIMASKFKDGQRSSQTSDAGFLQQRSERSVSNFPTSCMMWPSHNEGDSSINEHSIWLNFNFDHCRWYSFHMVLQPLTSTHVTTPPARSLAAKNLLQGKAADVMRFKEWLCWARDGCQLQILKQHVASNVRRPIG